MPLKLPPLQTVTQCASLVTAARAVWELSRLVRAKKREMDQAKEVERLLDEIEDFVREGVLTEREWKAFCYQVEEAMQRKDCTPREAQAKVLDFLEALHSIAQEFDDDEADDAYLSEPDEVDKRWKERHHPRRDSAVNSPSYYPSSSLPRSQTVPPFDPHPRRAPVAHQHYHAYSPLPSQYQDSRFYRPPGHPGTSRVSSPPQGNGIFSPGHLLHNHPTHYPNAPQSFSTRSAASPFSGGFGSASSPASAGAVSPNPSAFHTAGFMPPPPPNYSGPLPVPPSRSSSQQSWGPLPTQVPMGPTSPASTIPDQNGWAPNAAFPFPSGNHSNGNSNRPSAAPSPSYFRPSPAHNIATSPPENPPPSTASPNAAVSPTLSRSLSGSTLAPNNDWDGHIASPSGFTSPSQEAQVQRTAAARLRDHARRHSQAHAIAEELGVPDFDVPHPPHARSHQQPPDPPANWAADIHEGPREEGRNAGYRPAESVSEEGTYMEPAGAKNKRRRRRQ